MPLFRTSTDSVNGCRSVAHSPHRYSPVSVRLTNRARQTQMTPAKGEGAKRHPPDEKTKPPSRDTCSTGAPRVKRLHKRTRRVRSVAVSSRSEESPYPGRWSLRRRRPSSVSLSNLPGVVTERSDVTVAVSVGPIARQLGRSQSNGAGIAHVRCRRAFHAATKGLVAEMNKRRDHVGHSPVAPATDSARAAPFLGARQFGTSAAPGNAPSPLVAAGERTRAVEPLAPAGYRALAAARPPGRRAKRRF